MFDAIEMSSNIIFPEQVLDVGLDFSFFTSEILFILFFLHLGDSRFLFLQSGELVLRGAVGPALSQEPICFGLLVGHVVKLVQEVAADVFSDLFLEPDICSFGLVQNIFDVFDELVVIFTSNLVDGACECTLFGLSDFLRAVKILEAS